MKRIAFSICLLAGMAWCQNRPNAPAEAAGGNLPLQPIGASDLVAVSVYDAPEFTRAVRVGSDGLIRLPMVKRPIQAEGLMPAELEASIATALREAQLILDPFVTVSVAEYLSRPISVMGSVKRPLTFQAAGEVTLLGALARAEGLAADAGGDILVSRRQAGTAGAAAPALRIPVQALIDLADPSVNIRLTGGEEIRVPEAGKIFVAGNVKRPGAFTVQDEGGATIMKALAQSEGLLPFAARQAFIYRSTESGGKTEIPVELRRILQRKAPDVALRANDILYIPDNRGGRLSLAALERALVLGGSISTAMIYAGLR